MIAQDNCNSSYLNEFLLFKPVKLFKTVYVEGIDDPTNKSTVVLSRVRWKIMKHSLMR